MGNEGKCSEGKNTVSTPEKSLICICRLPEAGVKDEGVYAIHSGLLGLYTGYKELAKDMVCAPGGTPDGTEHCGPL